MNTPNQLDLDYKPIRTNAPETSVEAFAKVKRLRIADQVIYHLYIRKIYGATNSELVNLIRRNPHSVQPRTTDLSESSKQYIKPHPEGLKRKNKYGNDEIVWVLTSAGAIYYRGLEV